MNLFLLAASTGAFVCSFILQASALEPKVAMQPPELVAEPFDLSQVRLLDGPFREAMERDQQYLLSLDADRLLSGFRSEAGLEPKGEKYGGWEQQGVAGQSLGHYLSALSMMYAATGDDRFKERAAYIVDELAECQSANGNGYVGAVPNGKRIFDEVAAGKVETEGFSLNGAWVPWYTLHKLFAGLVDNYRFTGNEAAKQVLIGLCDWAHATINPLPEEVMQRMLRAEHGGMNEALANAYAITGDQRYLELARKFTHRSVFDPLAENRDELSGLHANTQVPKLVGAARIYQLTGDPYYRKSAEAFWNTVVHNRTYAQGGNSDHEHFFPPEETREHLSSATAETCNVYNMLRLTKDLFALTPAREEADFYERALFNQILGSQDPKRGMFTYFQSLRPGHFKVYSDETDAFWCCVGTGMENHARYGEAIYFHDDATLWVNLFIASELDWTDEGVVVRQETSYPAEPTTRLTLKTRQPTRLTLRLRVPSWIAGEPKLTVNDESVAPNIEDGYAVIDREWHDGDMIEWTVPMAVRAETLHETPDFVAFRYGPVVLAGQLGTEGLDDVDFYLTNHEQNRYGTYPAPSVPSLIGSPEALAESIERVEGQDPLTFRLPTPDGEAILLRPFADTHYVRYTVYWKTFPTKSAYEAERERLAELAEAERQLDLRTTDRVRPGEQQPEVDHNFRGENTTSGTAFGRRWRHASDGGFFEYDLEVDPQAAHELRVTYAGGDRGNRSFSILIDGSVIASRSLIGEKPNAFIEDFYPIPRELTDGKQHITVRFQADPGNIAGGIYDLRIVRSE